MLYYQLRSGNILSECDFHKAFEITTGEVYRYDSPAYLRWLYPLLGRSVVKVIREEELSLEQCIRGNNTVTALRIYRDTHQCTLREAKDAIDEMKANMNSEVQDKCNSVVTQTASS